MQDEIATARAVEAAAKRLSGCQQPLRHRGRLLSLPTHLRGYRVPRRRHTPWGSGMNAWMTLG